MLSYKVITGASGTAELEKKVSALINHGWKTIGGIGFNQGFPYQAMIGEMPKKPIKKKPEISTKADNKLTFNEAMKLLE